MSRKIKLSNRLMMVASFVTKGSNIADIGTDHGYIPIYLVKEQLVSKALAMDIGTGPLERARVHIAQEQLDSQIEVRLSDGLKELQPNEANCIIIAGMGGGLMVQILTDGLSLLDQKTELVLSPHSEWDKVRGFLQQNGFSIRKEAMLVEEDKYYTVLKAVKGSMPKQSYIQLNYGAYLIDAKDPVLIQYLKKEKKQYETIRDHLLSQPLSLVEKRLREIENELAGIMEALNEML